MDKEEMLKQIEYLKKELDRKTQQVEDLHKWWAEEQRENNRLYRAYVTLEKRVEELENEKLEVAQAKALSFILTDSAAKGVL